MADFPPRLRIGARGSQLSRWQAAHIAEKLAQLGVETELIVIHTHGDLDRRSAFGQMQSKGIFVKEIEEALLEGRIDLAVHSLKDLPTSLPAGLALAAVPERACPFDALISRTGQRLAELPAGARIATGSLRRAAQVLALRPDLQVVPIRGNVTTRLEKIERGEAEATLLAVAGLDRLELNAAITEVFTPEQVTPPMGQGALAIEARAGEHAPIFARLDHPATRRAVDAERIFLARIGGGCNTPAGVLAEPIVAEGWRLTALIASPDGRFIMREQVELTAADDPAARMAALAEAMLADAPPAIRSLLHHAEPSPDDIP